MESTINKKSHTDVCMAFCFCVKEVYFTTLFVFKNLIKSDPMLACCAAQGCDSAPVPSVGVKSKR